MSLNNMAHGFVFRSLCILAYKSSFSITNIKCSVSAVSKRLDWKQSCVGSVPVVDQEIVNLRLRADMGVLIVNFFCRIYRLSPTIM